MDSPEISSKIKSAIKAKLVELDSYVDDELPDYIMVMVANKKTQKQMQNDLEIFLHTQTPAFTKWLFSVLEKLEKITKDKKITDKPLKKDKKKKVKKTSEPKEEKGGKKEVAVDAAGAPVAEKRKPVSSSAEKGKKEKRKKVKPKEAATTTMGTKASQSTSPGAPTPSEDKKSDPPKQKISTSSKTQKSDKEKRSKSPKKPESSKIKPEVVLTEKVDKAKAVTNQEADSKDRQRSTSKEVRKQRQSSSSSSRSSSLSLSDDRSDRRRRPRRSSEREHRASTSPYRSRSRHDRSRSPMRGPHRGQRSRSPDRRGGFHNQRLTFDGRRRDFAARSPPDPRRRDDRDVVRHRVERRHSHDDWSRQHRDNRRHSIENEPQRRHHDARNRHPRDERRHSRDGVRRLSRSRSPAEKGEKLLSSVVAVVKKDRVADNDDDAYNPMKMLKTSIASKVQVPRPKSSSSRSDKNLNPGSKALVVRAFQEADSSIQRKKQEDLEREAQLEELRRRREEKLSKLRSKGIGVKTKRRHGSEGATKSEIRLTGSDIIRLSGEGDGNRRRGHDDDLDDDLEMEELKSTTNKKNFVIEIKNRVEPSSEDLRLRLDKRRLVVHPSDVNRNDGHRHDVKRHEGHRNTGRRSTSRDRSRSPPHKIVDVDERKKIQDDDKDLMEMRRRALESLARGRAQQQEQKKIIVPLDEGSSSSSDSDSDSSNSSSSDDSSDAISLTSTENEAEAKRAVASKEETTFVVTLEGIDASYFRNKAKPSQTNSLLKKTKKEDEHESGNMQDRGFEGPIVVEQRNSISVPVLAAVGGGSGRSDPKIDDSVYRTSKKPEAKVKPTVKVEKSISPKKNSTPKTESPKKEISSRGEASDPPKKIRKRIEPPTPDKPPPTSRNPISRDFDHPRPISRDFDHPRPISRGSNFVKAAVADDSRLPRCRYWPNCALGSRCSFYHPSSVPPTSSSASARDKYRWSSANAPV